MGQCWKDDALKRPSFEQLVGMLNDVIASGHPGAPNSSGLYQNIQTQPSLQQTKDSADNVDEKLRSSFESAATERTPEFFNNEQKLNNTAMAKTV
jgi:hypothetical protein